MRILAIECATEACSAALFDKREHIASRFELIGRGHAERLVPMIAELPGKGRADRILVSLGPGSFTGVRIGLAAARALGLAWGAEVLGYPTLALVAAMARRAHPGQPVSVCMTGGHGEYFVQDFGERGVPEQAARSRTPADAAAALRHGLVAGSKAREVLEIGERPDAATGLDILPDARHALLVPETLLTPALAPIYGRAPDAKPIALRPAER